MEDREFKEFRTKAQYAYKANSPKRATGSNRAKKAQKVLSSGAIGRGQAKKI